MNCRATDVSDLNSRVMTSVSHYCLGDIAKPILCMLLEIDLIYDRHRDTGGVAVSACRVQQIERCSRHVLPRAAPFHDEQHLIRERAEQPRFRNSEQRRTIKDHTVVILAEQALESRQVIATEQRQRVRWTVRQREIVELEVRKVFYEIRRHLVLQKQVRDFTAYGYSRPFEFPENGWMLEIEVNQQDPPAEQGTISGQAHRESGLAFPRHAGTDQNDLWCSTR